MYRYLLAQETVELVLLKQGQLLWRHRCADQVSHQTLDSVMQHFSYLQRVRPVVSRYAAL